jgi:hypothetical protein
MFAALVLSSLIAASADRAFTLPGEWTCEASDHASRGVADFTVHSGGFSMRYAYDESGTPNETDADFTYDARSATWSIEEPAGQLQRFRATAGPWTQQVWEFDGVTYPTTPGDSIYDQVERARVMFISFGNDDFEMIRSQQVGGQWVLHDPWYSSVTDDNCSRIQGK